MELTIKKDYITIVVLFWPRKDKEGSLKAEDITVCQKCSSHVHDKSDNTSTLHGFVKSE